MCSTYYNDHLKLLQPTPMTTDITYTKFSTGLLAGVANFVGFPQCWLKSSTRETETFDRIMLSELYFLEGFFFFKLGNLGASGESSSKLVGINGKRYLSYKMHRNSVYGHLEWARHKSPWRHGRHIYGILFSGILSALAPPVLACTLLATFVTVFNHFVIVGRLPQSIPILEVASLPFTLTSSVLSLLLVFRTNSSYNRFDEARKIWGSNVNRTRDLARQGLTWIRNPTDAAKLSCLLRHIKAYPFCLKDHLLEDFTLREELEQLLEPQELEAIMSSTSTHRPNYVLQVLSTLLHQCSISEWEKITMDENITTFHDNVGGCERILKTPIPVAYTLLTSRFLILWHLALPFALWRTCGWLTIPATFSTAAALFYIEQVGVMIEEPFWILPLLSMCTGIVSAVDGLSAAHKGAALLWSFHQPSTDHVVQITFESSKSDGFRNNRDEINRVVLTRMNSIA